jgi:hypothetical protein
LKEKVAKIRVQLDFIKIYNWKLEIVYHVKQSRTVLLVNRYKTRMNLSKLIVYLVISDGYFSTAVVYCPLRFLKTIITIVVSNRFSNVLKGV